MKKLLSLFIMIACLFLPLCVYAAVELPSEPLEPGIRIRQPGWTNKDIAVVDILVDPLPLSLEARMDTQREFTDVTSDSNFKMRENGILYVKAIYGTEENQKESIRSFVIECFDRTAPTFTVVQNGTRLSITARDNLSGIRAFYVNDNTITDFEHLTGATASIEYRTGSRDTSVIVFVEDNAGNLSSMQTIRPDASNTNNTGNQTEADAGRVGNASISLTKPEWTRKNSVFVKVNVTGQNIDMVEAKTSRNAAWENITSTMDFKLTENSDVYVRATDTKGAVTTHSEYIECFDRTSPDITAIQDGQSLNVLTADSQSGTEFIFVNGRAHKTQDGTISVPVTQSMSNMMIQAKDYAGNFSEILTLAVDPALAGFIEPSYYDPGITAPAAEVMYYPDYREETRHGAIYNLVLSDGQSYSVEELQQMGLPVYVLTDVDEYTLRNMVQEVHARQVIDDMNEAAYQMPEEEDSILLIDEELFLEEDAGAEAPSPEAGKNSLAGIIIIGVIVAALGVAGFLYFKKVNAKYDKDDLYESEYDPDRNAYGDDYDDIDISLDEADVSY